MNNAAVRYSFKITGYPLVDAALERVFLTLASLMVGAIFAWLRSKGFHVEMLQDWLNSNGLQIENLQEWLVGGVVAILATLGALIWSLLRSRTNLATYVQAGINLVLSHEAVTTDGKTITSLGAPGATPSLPVTPAAGAKIVKDFATVEK
jgi:hypothetical protein